MTIGIPQIGDSVPWNEIPEFYNDLPYRPDDGVVFCIDEDLGIVFVEVPGWGNELTVYLKFDLDGSSWDSTGQWKRDFQWGYQREQVNQEQDDEVLDGFAQMG